MFQQTSCSYKTDGPRKENDLNMRSEEFVSKETKNNRINLPEITQIMLELVIIKNVNTLNSKERAGFLTFMNALLGLSYELR